MRRGKQAKILKTLVFYDSPQVILLELKLDCYAVAVAIDSAVDQLKFLAVEIDERELAGYLREQCDLRYLFKFPRRKAWYQFDLMDATENTVTFFRTSPDIYANEKHLPSRGFFAREHTDEYVLEAVGHLDEKRYEIDGGWELNDFTKFYRKISDQYAFFLSLGKFASLATDAQDRRRILQTLIEAALRGGGSYVNLFTDLKRTQSSAERLAVQSIQYASPGHVAIKGKLDVFRQIDKNLENLSEDFDNIKSLYDNLYRYLQKNKLLKADKNQLDPHGAVSEYIVKETSKLAGQLGVDDCDLLFQMAGRNALTYSKVVMAHFRRSRDYFFFFAEGRVEHAQDGVRDPSEK